MNIANKFIPFIIIPYITRVLDPQGFGIVSFGLAFIGYFIIIIDYGFNLTGVRQVSINIGSKERISRIFTVIYFTKLLLFFISTILVFILIILFENLTIYKEVILIYLILAFSHVILPNWFLQGLQQMKDLTILSVVVRIIFLVSVFIFIKDSNDVKLYVFLYSISFVLIGLISLIHIFFILKYRFVKINIKNIVEQLKEGSHLFFSSIIIIIIQSTGIIILGIYYAPEFSGYYAALLKINQLILIFYYPISLAVFPHITQMYEISFAKGINYAKKVIMLVIPFFVLLSIIILIFKESLIITLFGPEFVAFSNVLVILAIIPILSIISNVLGNQILVASGNNKLYSLSFVYTCIISLILYIVLGYNFGIYGVAFSALISEVILAIILFLFVRKVILIKGP